MNQHPQPWTPTNPTDPQLDPTTTAETQAVDGVPPRRWVVAPGFARQTVLPLAGFVAALAAVTAAGRHWRSLAFVLAVLPVAVVIQWALGIHRATLAGAPVHPAAAHAATVVIGLVTVAAAALIVTVAVHPAALTALDVLLRGGAR